MVFLWEIAKGSVILFYSPFFFFFLPALGLHGGPWASRVVALGLVALGECGILHPLVWKSRFLTSGAAGSPLSSLNRRLTAQLSFLRFSSLNVCLTHAIFRLLFKVSIWEKKKGIVFPIAQEKNNLLPYKDLRKRMKEFSSLQIGEVDSNC